MFEFVCFESTLSVLLPSAGGVADDLTDEVYSVVAVFRNGFEPAVSVPAETEAEREDTEGGTKNDSTPGIALDCFESANFTGSDCSVSFGRSFSIVNRDSLFVMFSLL